MTAAAPVGPPEAPTPPPRRAGVVLPTEHGGWSLTLEPVLLGLLVAWSPAGLALGLGAFVAFLARTPLKLVLVDRWRHRWLARSRQAARVLAAETVVLVVLVSTAVLLAQERFWLPLVLATPLVVIELWFDMRSRSRRLLPELAGTIGIGSVAAAIALADGRRLGVALGLWCVVAARAGAAIPYVRTQLQRGRHKPYRSWPSDAAQLVAIGAVAVGYAADAVPLAAALAVAVAALLNLALVRTRPRPAVVIGVQQTLVGLAVVLVTAVAVLAA